MSCCCSALGGCSTKCYQPVNKKYFEDLASRLGIEISGPVSWCDSHRLKYGDRLAKKCVVCLRNKEPRMLRPASSKLSNCHPGDRICTRCSDARTKSKPEFPTISTSTPISPSIPLPLPSPASAPCTEIEFIKSLIEEQYFLTPVKTKWLNMIRSGEKKWKYFDKKLKPDRINKIILLRSCTPDSQSRVICGAIVLKQYDSNAPQDPAIGYTKEWSFGHYIRCFIPFSVHRCIFSKALAGCYPKRVCDDNVRLQAKEALQVFCGLRKDE